MNYPPPPRTDIVDTLHGVDVADPFRPLEAADSPDTAAWVEAQNALTRRALDLPMRPALVARLRALHRVPRISAAAVRGERLFFLENDGTRAQAILYVAAVDPAADAHPTVERSPTTATVLVDPHLLDADGTTAITVFEPDDAGERVAYGLSRHGSDVQELLVHDMARGVALDDRLQWVKFASIAWWHDGFFYTRYPQPGTVPPEHEQYFCQVWFHRLGDRQSADRRVYERRDAPEVTFEVDVTADARHLVITSRRGASDDAEVHVVALDPTVRPKADTTYDLRTAGPEANTTHGFRTVGSEAEATYDFRNVEAVVTGFSAGWHFIDGTNGILYFVTDAGAPCGRIVRVDLDAPSAEPATVVPESRDTIVAAAIAGGHLLVSSLQNASSRLVAWPLDGAPAREIVLPGLGTIVALAAGWAEPHAFATYTSFTMPPMVMACDIDAGGLTPVRPSALPIDPAVYTTEQVWYASKDGTPISMFLVSRPTPLSTEAHGAVLLSGYGGFNISLTPAFDPSDFLWLDAGGVLAVANLRGGGEYGDSWHRAGMRERKQNVFDDFIAAAEWLDASGRVRPGRIAIEGGSNGGLLVGACMVQRPDLFGAVVCRVPVADMLRYHRFTVGRFWIPEYGCADDAADFPFLRRYSPYHNVVDGTAYPPTLVMTADTDDRVAPGMAKKFAARLQQAAADRAGPILLRVETRAGHGAGKPIGKQIDEQADICAFLFHYLTRTSEREQPRRPPPDRR
jgi:prolyl oligopeptidase